MSVSFLNRKTNLDQSEARIRLWTLAPSCEDRVERVEPSPDFPSVVWFIFSEVEMGYPHSFSKRFFCHDTYPRAKRRQPAWSQRPALQIWGWLFFKNFEKKLCIVPLYNIINFCHTGKNELGEISPDNILGWNARWTASLCTSRISAKLPPSGHWRFYVGPLTSTDQNCPLTSTDSSYLW